MIDRLEKGKESDNTLQKQNLISTGTTIRWHHWYKTNKTPGVSKVEIRINTNTRPYIEYSVHHPMIEIGPTVSKTSKPKQIKM